MKQRNRKRPKREGIHLVVINVVGCVKTYDARQKSPGAKGSGRQWCHLGSAVAARVDAMCQTERDERLEGVEDGENGNLRKRSESYIPYDLRIFVDVEDEQDMASKV